MAKSLPTPFNPPPPTTLFGCDIALLTQSVAVLGVNFTNLPSNLKVPQAESSNLILNLTCDTKLKRIIAR